MAIKRRLIECECGETFIEASSNKLEGDTLPSPWKFKSARARGTKSTAGSDILVSMFQRSIHCNKCKQELLRENCQYEITPPVAQNDEPITSYYTREFVMKSGVEPEVPVV